MILVMEWIAIVERVKYSHEVCKLIYFIALGP